ncbi:MAG: hypothetical protein ABR564_00345 [Candidatus Dormibacteria bacterium]
MAGLRGRVRGMAQAMPRRARRGLVAIVVVVTVAAAFVGVVLPLFHFGTVGPASAEISGLVPDHATVARSTDMEVAIDNTGVSSIRPVCIAAHFDAPVKVEHVVFQGLDRVPFSEGLVCGGRLNREETISVRISLIPQTLGPVQVSVAPAEGRRTIGGDLHGVMEVAP